MEWLKKLGPYRFCLSQSLSPTYYNLNKFLKEKNWKNTRFRYRSHFNEQHFNFDIKVAEQLEFKHLLAKLIAQYCPHVMPTTFCINDQNWSSILSEIIANQMDHLTWILKPSLLNNGKQIKIFSQIDQIEQHYLSFNRLGGEHVLQQYLTQPHLLKGHKYSVRMFVILTNYAGVYLYPNGYFNVALHPYQSHHFTDLRAHLTNEHLHTDESNVIQIPTQRFDFFPEIYDSIKLCIKSIISGLIKKNSNNFVSEKQRNLAIFGFDFMIDKDMRVWLLEANHGPCFPVSDDHPLQKYLYREFWEAFISSFVLPIAMQLPSEAIQYERFECIGFNSVSR